jgi:hypothetical protein
MWGIPFKKNHIPWNKGKKNPGIGGRKKGGIPWNQGIKQWKDKKPPNLGKHWKCKDTSKMGSRGEKNGMWKGGVSRVYKTGYYSIEYKKWRISVFKRDNFRCQGCEQVGGYLTAHHIKSFAQYPKLRFNINNGITLCEACHSLTDNYKGRAKSKKQ